MWSISTILTGLYSFMLESNPTLGSIETSTRQKRHLASVSLEYNVTHDPQFTKLFPEYVARHEEQMRQRAASRTGNNATSSSASSNSLSPPRHAPEGVPHAFVVAAVAAILSIVMAVRFL